MKNVIYALTIVLFVWLAYAPINADSNHTMHKCDFNETDCFSLCDINETCSHLSCTGMFTTFKCRRGVIRMLDFFFGRTRLDVCPYKQMVVSCVNFTTQQETNARRMCDDDPSCILQASFDFKDKCPQNWTREPWEGIWGDPCPDHSKYLNLTYTCIDKEPWNFFQTPWTNWSECSATCGIGTASRTRTCTEQPGKECTVSSCAFKLKDDPGLFYQATPCRANATCPTPSFTTSYKRHHRSTSHYVIAPTSSRVTRSSVIPTAPTLPEKPDFYANVTLTMIWRKFCEAEAQFRNGVSKMLERRIQERVSADQVVILNKEKCAEHANQGDKANVKFVITVKSSNEPSEPLTKVAVEELLKLINNGRTTDVGGDFKNGTITDIVLVVHKTPQERVLPVWIIVLITIAAICLLIWIVFLCRYCCCRQRCVGGDKKSFIISNGPFTYAYKNKKSLTAEPLFRSSMRVKLSLNEVDNPNYEIQEVEGKDGKIRYSLSPVPEKIDEEKPPQVDNNPRQSITKVFMDGKVISEIPTAALGQEAIKISLASNIAIEEEQDSQL